MEDAVQRIGIIKKKQSVGLVQRYLIYGYFLLAFFEPYLNGMLGSFAKYYILLLIGVLCIAYTKLKIRQLHLCFLIWLAYKCVSVLWSSNLYIPKLHIFSQIGMVGLLVILTAIPLDKKTIQSIVNTMWLGSFAIGVLSLFYSHAYHGVVATRQVLYLFGQEADPNNQAAFLLIGLTIALYKLFSVKKQYILSCTTIAVNTYSLFMTGSRGGLVGLTCVGVGLFLMALGGERFRSKVKDILIIVFICVGLYFIATRYLPSDIYERLFTFSSYEGGSERDIIWQNGWELFSSNFNFLFGAGWGAYYGYNGFYAAMHNTFLSMLCDVGILGFSLFFIPIIYICTTLIKRKNVLPVLLLISGLAPSFFIEAINKRFFWNVIFLVIIMYVNYRREET